MRGEEQETVRQAPFDTSMQRWRWTSEALEHASKYSNRFLEGLAASALSAALKPGTNIDEAMVASARAMIAEAGEGAASELLGDVASSTAVEYLLGPRILEDLAAFRTKPDSNLFRSLLVELEGRGIVPQGGAGTPGIAHADGRLQPIEGHAVIRLDAAMEGRVEAQPPSHWATASNAYLLLLLTLMVWFLINWNAARETICDINGRLPPAASFAEARKFVRRNLCGVPAAYVRIVSGDKVNVRAEPRMKAEVITTLTKGQPVTVVSHQNRKWLEVSFQREGYVIEGWVSRSYLAKVR